MQTEFIVETDRLWLRQFVPDDAEAVLEYSGKPEVMQYVAPCLTSVEEAVRILAEGPLSDYGKYGFGRWAVVLKENQRVIGFAGLKFLEDLQEVDLGYLLMPECWGKGLATEAARASVNYGFETLRLSQILGLVEVPNVRSVHVLEKIGFEFAKLIEYHSHTVAQYVLKAQ